VSSVVCNTECQCEFSLSLCSVHFTVSFLLYKIWWWLLEWLLLTKHSLKHRYYNVHFIHYWHLHLHLFRSKNNSNTIKWQKNRTTRHMACSNMSNTCQDGRQCFLKELSSSPAMGLRYTVSSPGGSGAELQLKLNLVHFSHKNLASASWLQLEWLKIHE